MPLNLGVSSRTADVINFDLESAANLYWATVPAVIHQQGKEQHRGSLTVRILSGVDRQSPSSRILRINFSREDEQLFLHTLEVGEDDFQTLKVEQGILVDFSSFPAKLVSLLQRCIDSRGEQQPRFQAVLICNGADTTFKVVETNDFNQLPHITLCFRPGDDAAIKKFLAFRLSEVKAEGAELLTGLTESKAACARLQADLTEATECLTAANREAERSAVQGAAEQQSRDAAALQARTQQVAAVREQADRDAQEARKRHLEEARALQARLEALDGDNRALREAKALLDSRASELACRLGVAEGNARALDDEASHLRGVASSAARDRADRDAEASDLRARLRLGDDKVQGQQQTMWEQSERIKGLEATVRHLEERCGELKAAVAAQETRASSFSEEASRGSHAVKKLTEELNLAREKLKRKADAVARLEEELAAKQAALEQAGHASRSSAHAHERLQADFKDLQEEKQRLKGKLEDSKQQLQGNEQMIRWLNAQVNEAQMQLGSMSVASRYSHPRPTQLAPQTPVLPAGTASYRPAESYSSYIKATGTADHVDKGAKLDAFTGTSATGPGTVVNSKAAGLGTDGMAGSIGFSPKIFSSSNARKLPAF